MPKKVASKRKMKYDRTNCFGRQDQSVTEVLVQKLTHLAKDVSLEKKPGFPIPIGNFDTEPVEVLEKTILGEDPIDEKDMDELLGLYLENLPDYRNPGTMINVIPPVNLTAMAASVFVSQFNPNLAQDTYSGNIYLAELQASKICSDFIGWDWRKSAGIFTFGGKGTNLYGTKLALLNAFPESWKYGMEKGKCFLISSENAHPCHSQVCDWLGIGKEACISLPCNDAGVIQFEMMEETIKQNVEKGRIFLGVNLNGGSTNEFAIDPIKKTRCLVDRIVHEYSLTYTPWIHVDSVLGWIFLMFQDYDFLKNPLQINKRILPKIKRKYDEIKELIYADSVGIDFHKSGFCPNVSSMFLCRDQSTMWQLGHKGTVHKIDDIHYGEYNPYTYTLECSRSVGGPVSAVISLLSMGKSGFRKEVINLLECVDQFREKLKHNPKVLVLNNDNCSFATLFSLVPNEIELSKDELFNLCAEEEKKLREYNDGFGSFVLSKAINRRNSYLITASRSYVIPGTQLRIGALKVWMSSVFMNSRAVANIFHELECDIDEYTRYMEYKSMIKTNVNGMISDPSH